MTVKSAYNEIYTQLAPRGMFLQKGSVPEGVRGFPVESVIAILTIVVICEFLKGFFSELGKKAAKNSLEKIAHMLRSTREVKEEDQRNIENLVKSIDMSDVAIEQKERAHLCGEREIRRALIQAGLPSYRAEPIVKKCAQTIRGEIIGSCEGFD